MLYEGYKKIHVFGTNCVYETELWMSLAESTEPKLYFKIMPHDVILDSQGANWQIEICSALPIVS